MGRILNYLNKQMNCMKEIVYICVSILLASCTASHTEKPLPIDIEAYKKEITEWDQKRYDYQKGENGWINLAGLFWLKEGINTFGSDASNDLVFPEGKIPPRAGFFLLKQNVIELEAIPGVEFSFNGQSAKKGIFAHPDSGRITVSYGSLKWFVIKRDDKYGIRLRDLESHELEKFHGIERYPADPAWRIVGSVEWADSSRTIEITNVLGQTGQQRSVGTLVFSIENKEYRIDALDEGGDEFFIIFGDETNARETYGAGRYMYVKVPESGNEVIIDFNKAYNPPCAFTEFATCPLPPKQNILPIAIPAGEKNYGSH